MPMLRGAMGFASLNPSYGSWVARRSPSFTWLSACYPGASCATPSGNSTITVDP
jgi:hypothetical protein